MMFRPVMLLAAVALSGCASQVHSLLAALPPLQSIKGAVGGNAGSGDVEASVTLSFYRVDRSKVITTPVTVNAAPASVKGLLK